jgi:hypothetical protein
MTMAAAASGDVLDQRAVERTDSRASSSRLSSRRGTADSVFRGRPGDPTTVAAPSAAAAMEDSPQKILLSLRTPSHSFEEKDGSGDKKDGKSSAEKPGGLIVVR